MNKFFQH